MLLGCGWFCLCLSVWAIAQLSIMGIMYKLEVSGFIHDTEEHDFESVEDFLEKTKENYSKCARNCFIAAGIYALVLLSALGCIWKARKDEKKRQLALLDDDLTCTVEEKVLTEKQKKKIK